MDSYKTLIPGYHVYMILKKQYISQTRRLAVKRSAVRFRYSPPSPSEAIAQKGFFFLSNHIKLKTTTY